ETEYLEPFYLMGDTKKIDLEQEGDIRVELTVPKEAEESVAYIENGGQEQIVFKRGKSYQIDPTSAKTVAENGRDHLVVKAELVKDKNVVYRDLLNKSLHLETNLMEFDVKDKAQIEAKYEVAKEMTERIGKIDKVVLETLSRKGTSILLIDYPITDTEAYGYLKGQIPRGWEGVKGQDGHQLTWDDVPGAGSIEGKPVVARIGYSERGKGHNTINLELHETAHAIDRVVFLDISKNEWFQVPFQEQKNFLTGAYFTNKEEYFAECFAYYYFSDASRKELKEKAPTTYSYIEMLIHTLQQNPHYFDKK
ncbi:anthrax toxin lethal factor-related metalloendopeptidase, partial [Bacillus cereus]